MEISELDYYGILAVSRDASKEELTLAYRKLAIRLHPFTDPKHQKDFVPICPKDQLHHMSSLPVKLQWNYINMAFNVLGDDLYRAIYDRYGEAGLFQGILLPNGYFPPYQYHGNDMLVYQKVFGSYSPYANLTDVVTNPPPLCNNFKKDRLKKEKAVKKIVELSLEDIYTGCVKIMQVWRQEYTDKEKTHTEKRKKILTLHIEPGVTAGTRYCFKEEGDCSSTSIPADIIFIIGEKPHKIFRRENHSNLVHTLKIDLCQALTGFQFVLNTLDKRKLNVCVSDVVKPGYRKVLSGEGLPRCKNTDVFSSLKPQEFESKEHGDLIIEFENYIPRDMKKLVQEFFSKLCETQKEFEKV